MQDSALERNNARHENRLGSDLLKSSSVEKDFGILVDSKLSISQQCSDGQESQQCPGMHHEEHCQQDKEADSAPLLSPCEARLEFHVHLWAPQYKIDKELLKGVQQRDTKMMKEQKHFSYNERLRKMGLFSLEKRQLRGGSCQCKYLRGQCWGWI